MSKLYFYYAAMNAGKSTHLLQTAHNYRERNMDVAIFTAKIADRDGLGVVKSRVGISEEVLMYDKDTCFLDKKFGLYKTHIKCLLIEEAQFLTETQVMELCYICDKRNVPTLCYGLRSDFTGKGFEGSISLLVNADELCEIKTICTCGKKATHNMRVDSNGKKIRSGETVLIGGNESYISKCRNCFN